LSDKELIAGCLKNDSNSQRVLFYKYAGVMKTLCLRYVGDDSEADDVMQEGFIKMFGNLRTFRHDGSFEGWLRRIMINSCLRHIIDKKKMRIDSMEDLTDTWTDEPEIDSRLSEQDLLKGLMKLPPGYRTIFNMYVLEGYSHKEIGKQLGIQESTSRSQLVKAKGFLKKILNDRDFY
jgi:RNA polymerase sigma-70 factor (ECF subfamily)